LLSYFDDGVRVLNVVKRAFPDAYKVVMWVFVGVVLLIVFVFNILPILMELWNKRKVV